ncbi:uncharacterized protein [Spinacia oleracea]|uniref:Reverse transcriptase zinc-binding domain-containing protein n=1 Tax=Spinacia oleracea TaxID=3562 RepID=A0ABM3QYY5_SPIOL|nr:uncharacterized protein LOC130463463 [Spinacia oleracea]
MVFSLSFLRLVDSSILVPVSGRAKISRMSVGCNTWPNGQSYSISQVYKKLLPEVVPPYWSTFIWTRSVVPKHRFILWLAMLKRLPTCARLFHIGISDSDACVICGNAAETQDHIFGSCTYAIGCFSAVMQWLQIPYRTVGLDTLCRWIRNGYKASQWRKHVLLVAVAATVYMIWQVRNKGY